MVFSKIVFSKRTNLNFGYYCRVFLLSFFWKKILWTLFVFCYKAIAIIFSLKIFCQYCTQMFLSKNCKSLKIKGLKLLLKAVIKSYYWEMLLKAVSIKVVRRKPVLWIDLGLKFASTFFNSQFNFLPEFFSFIGYYRKCSIFRTTWLFLQILLLK